MRRQPENFRRLPPGIPIDGVVSGVVIHLEPVFARPSVVYRYDFFKAH